MTPEEEERRGEEARMLLLHPIYREAFATIKERLITQLSLADLPDDTRAKCNVLLVSLATVQRYFEQVAKTGELAATEIERKRTLRERLRAVV